MIGRASSHVSQCDSRCRIQTAARFERYTEKVRRIIFFAHYEASQLDQAYIETEHHLLRRLPYSLLNGALVFASVRVLH